MKRQPDPLPDESSTGSSTKRLCASDCDPFAAHGGCTAEFAFPRSARLLTGADYRQVFEQNKRYSDKYWTILVRRGLCGPARLGLAIAKKRARRAVDRNKLKRIVREAFRHRRFTLAGLDLVVMNRDAATVAPVSDLRLSMDRLLMKISHLADTRRQILESTVR